MPDAIGSGIDSRHLTGVDGLLFFSGRFENGHELWKSDGITTSLVKDIHPGTNGSNPQVLTNADGVLYFIANDGMHGTSLWKSDGTSEGTVWIKSLISILQVDKPCFIIPAAGIIYFVVRKHPWLWDLWRSDGTTEGTFMIYENFANGEIQRDMFAVLGSSLVFPLTDALGGLELWTTDGTVTGTHLLKDISMGTASSYPGPITRIDNTLYFKASNPVYGEELWKSDGTEAGTELVKDIKPGSLSSNISGLTNFNGSLLFYANDGTNAGTWTSDGTTSGTLFLSNSIITNSRAVVANKIYYITYNQSTWRYELWVWDGTAQSSSLVRVMNSYSSTLPTNLLEFNGLLYFIADEGNQTSPGGQEIWRSDGTTDGTFPVTDFEYHATFNFQSAAYLTKVDGSLFFTVAADADSGNELWKTDGISGHETQLTDLPFATYDGYNFDIAVMNGYLYFPAGTQTNGHEPWKSDGTGEGTVILKDIVPGGQYSSSSPGNYVVGNNTLFFVASSKLWKSDGTTSGTMQIADAGNVSVVNSHVFIDNTLYFPESDANYGYELRKSEFPYATSQVIKDIVPGPNPSNPSGLILHKNSLFFSANINGKICLWRSNGTAETTIQVKELHQVHRLTSSGNFVYFLGDDGTHGLELWKSDGTEEGTVLVKDITSGSQGTAFEYFVIDVNGIIYFIVADAQYGAELWRSDGTSAGTSIVRDIFAGSGGASISNAVPFGGMLYFSADDGIHGKELWRTDGSPEGTTMVLDANPGLYSSEPYNFLVHESVLYFTAYDNVTRSLWKTTGIPCGTIKVVNNPDVVAGGSNRNIEILNNTIFIEGWTVNTGWELYKHAVTNDLALNEECKIIQTISFDPIEDKTFGSTFKLSASSNSGLPIHFTTSTPDLISINGNEVNILKAGTALISAHQNGNNNFAAASADQSFLISKADQSITFPAVSLKVFGSAPFTLMATASSGLPVSYTSSDPSVASVSGDLVTVHKPGTLTFIASQEGNENYNSATSSELSLTINKADQSITFLTISPKAFGSTPFTLMATASSGLPVSYTSSDPSLASVSGALVTIHKPGNVTFTALQEGNENYNSTELSQSLNIDKAQQEITFTPVAPITFGEVPFPLNASSNSGLPVNFISLSDNFTISGSHAIPVASGRATVRASQPGNEFYSAAPSVEQSFCINPRKPFISLEETIEGFRIVSDNVNGEILNIWYRDGEIIPDVSGSMLLISSSGEYTSRVVAEDCMSDESDGINLVITGIEIPLSGNMMSFFPNPASDKLTVKLSSKGEKDIQIFNSHGKSVFSTKTSDESVILDVSDFLPGAYFLHISDVRISQYGKLMIH